MRQSPPPPARRHFLAGAANFGLLAILPGCRPALSSGTIVDRLAGGDAYADVEPTVSPDGRRLNLALTLEYIGASFFTLADRGSGIPAAFTGGIGRAGRVLGGHAVPFADGELARHVSETSRDKLSHVEALRDVLGPEASALPTIDFSATRGGAFSTAAIAAGVVPVGAVFDPFAVDGDFLLAAMFLEDLVTAAYRALVDEVESDAALPVVQTNLADAIYSSGMVRALVERKAVDDPVLAASSAAIRRISGRLASGGAPGSLEEDAAGALDMADSDGSVIPFTRGRDQVLGTLRLDALLPGAGGFLPDGANGLDQAA